MEKLEFSFPPVQAVELTLFFDAVPLKLVTIAPLVARLQERFPFAEERFARVPWNFESQSDSEPLYIDEGAEEFPFPWLTFSDGEGHAVSLQGDRFTLRWEFGDDRGYPGYVTLSSQLRAEFAALEEHSGPIAIRQARAEYDNQLPQDAAWTVAQRTFTNSTEESARVLEGLEVATSGGQFHFDEDEGVTHVDFAAISRGETGTLSLRATMRAREDGLLGFEDLDIAHGRLIECFEKLTTDEQQRSWGKK